MPKAPRTPVDKLARAAAKSAQKVVGAPKPRRTQAERRAATRTALLDAAIASLVLDGYANLTTRRVAERAGVSQGTQQHYFATKQAFVVEAMRYAAEQIAADGLQRIDPRDLADPDRHEKILDDLWRIHRSDAFGAALELWIAARTDEVLREALGALEQDVTRLISGSAKALLDGSERLPSMLPMLDLALATVRGYAMLAPVVSDRELERRWKIARGQLARALRVQLDAST